MQPISQLLFFLENFLLVGQPVPERDILETILMHLLVLERLNFLPLV
jgi:hypothetical protein